MDLRIKDKDFQFRQTEDLKLEIEALELPISEHIEEMRQRLREAEEERRARQAEARKSQEGTEWTIESILARTKTGREPESGTE